MTLISSFYPVLPSGKEIPEKLIVQHLGSKMSYPQIEQVNTSESVHYKEDDEWKQFHPFPAISQLLVLSFCDFFSRKLLKAISGCSRPLHRSRNVSKWGFNRGRAVHKGPQGSAIIADSSVSQKKDSEQAAAGAQMPRALDHFADFLQSLAVNFFSPF